MNYVANYEKKSTATSSPNKMSTLFRNRLTEMVKRNITSDFSS